MCDWRSVLPECNIFIAGWEFIRIVKHCRVFLAAPLFVSMRIQIRIRRSITHMPVRGKKTRSNSFSFWKCGAGDDLSHIHFHLTKRKKKKREAKVIGTLPDISFFLFRPISQFSRPETGRRPCRSSFIRWGHCALAASPVPSTPFSALCTDV